MGPLSRSAVLSALAAACLGGALAAQPAADAGFSESIDVDVVDVDVFVSDRAGRPVPGLTREDFELRVDGKPAAITNFAAGARAAEGSPAPVAGAPSRAPAAARTEPSPAPVAEERPLTVAIFIDNLDLTPSARNQTLQLLESFFRRGLHRRDRVLIASYDGRDVKLSLPAAGDGEAAVAALREAAAQSSRGALTTAEWLKGLQDLINAIQNNVPPEVTEARERLSMLRLRRQGEAHRVLVTLGSFVDGLAGLRGRKSLLYLSGELWVDSGDSAFRELGQRANAAGVTLYGLGAQPNFQALFMGTTAISGEELSTQVYGNFRADYLARRLQEVVGPTGGVAAVDLNRPAFLLDRIRADFQTYYSLGFSPAAPHDGKRHALAVQLKGKARRGLEVRFPAGFTTRTREELLAGRTRAALLTGAMENPLGLRLAVERDGLAPSGNRTVDLLVAFPLAGIALQPGGGGEEGQVVLFVAARDSAGRSLPMRRVAIPVRLPAARLAAARQDDATYRLRLELPLGASTLAVGLRDERGGGESTIVARYIAGSLAAAHAAHPANTVQDAPSPPPPGGR